MNKTTSQTRNGQAAGASADVPPEAMALIGAARAGCSRSLGELAERYRRYLLMVANGSLSPALRVKVGASDLVQETLLHFQRKFGRFEGSSEEELLTWLRRILYFRALQVARRFGGTAARDVRRELPLAECGSSCRPVPLVDDAPTPCNFLLAKEQIADLDAAIGRLPGDARKLIQMRNVERRNFRDMGEILGCTPAAARKRWVRAVAQLRAAMNGHE
jgi:RNA polymerase sigma-70 factor (ECF subfamily)